MIKRCVLCGEVIVEEFGKLQVTVVKNKDEQGALQLVYVCCDCQGKERWYEKAQIKGV